MLIVPDLEEVQEQLLTVLSFHRSEFLRRQNEGAQASLGTASTATLSMIYRRRLRRLRVLYRRETTGTRRSVGAKGIAARSQGKHATTGDVGDIQPCLMFWFKGPCPVPW